MLDRYKGVEEAVQIRELSIPDSHEVTPKQFAHVRPVGQRSARRQRHSQLPGDLALPAEAGELRLSPKETEAPGLAEAAGRGLLPTWSDARAFYTSLNKGN